MNVCFGSRAVIRERLLSASNGQYRCPAKSGLVGITLTHLLAVFEQMGNNILKRPVTALPSIRKQPTLPREGGDYSGGFMFVVEGLGVERIPMNSELFNFLIRKYMYTHLLVS